MTGNTTRAAVSAEAGIYSHAAKLLVAIIAFVAGNAGGIVVAHKFERRIFAVLMAVGSLVAIAALLRGELGPRAILPRGLRHGHGQRGRQAYRGLPIGLTYVTGALSVSAEASAAFFSVTGALIGASRSCRGWAC